MPERFKVTRSDANLGRLGGSGNDLGGRVGSSTDGNGRHRIDEEAATGRLLPHRNHAGESRFVAFPTFLLSPIVSWRLLGDEDRVCDAFWD